MSILAALQMGHEILIQLPKNQTVYVMPPTCKVTLITQTTSKLHNIVDFVIIGFHGGQEGLMPLYHVLCLFQVNL
jgi:hypothetical protein